MVLSLYLAASFSSIRPTAGSFLGWKPIRTPPIHQSCAHHAFLHNSINKSKRLETPVPQPSNRRLVQSVPWFRYWNDPTVLHWAATEKAQPSTDGHRIISELDEAEADVVKQ